MNPVIETIGLTKSFGHTRGIVDLKLVVPPGQIFAFLGPNGAGKTTTIRILLDLQRASAGSAHVLGLDTHHDSVEVHRRIGYLPGDLALYPRLTGTELLNWSLRMRGLSDPAQVRALAERLDIDLTRRVRELSTGNRQKVGIVLAMAHEPDLLILDEPTTGLDPLVQDEFEILLREVTAAGRSVFISTHKLDEVQRVADHVGIIKEGRLVLTDSVDGLRRRSAQTVHLRFRDPVDATRFERPGVRITSNQGTQLTLSVTGPIGPVLRAAAELDPVEFTSNFADLDQLFLSVYRDPDQRGENHAL